MKRKAILIEASNVIGHTDLPGARVDIANWNDFLKSNLGGVWESSEIVILRKPSSGDVEQHLKVDSDCYCFVAFSGHGSEGSVLLNEHWSDKGFPINGMKPKSSQGTLIVDSCRGFAEAARYSEITKVALANASGRAVALNASMGRSVEFAEANEISERLILNRAGLISRHRQYWEDALKKSPNGVVEMLACSKGQAAAESPTSGGYYTSLLLQSADLWQRIMAERIHTTKNAHDYAVGKLPVQQTPEYRPSHLAFPFAVNG